MEKIKLSELVEVSNNSRLTQMVEQMLNQKLAKNETHIFKEWLRIVKQNKK